MTPSLYYPLRANSRLARKRTKALRLPLRKAVFLPLPSSRPFTAAARPRAPPCCHTAFSTFSRRYSSLRWTFTAAVTT